MCEEKTSLIKAEIENFIIRKGGKTKDGEGQERREVMVENGLHLRCVTVHQIKRDAQMA